MDKFKDITDEALATLATEKRTAIADLFALENPTPEQVAEAEALATEITEIDTEIDRRQTAAAESAERFAALKKQFSGEGEKSEEEQAAAEEAERERLATEEAEREEAARKEREEAAAKEADEKATQEAAAKKGGVAALAGKSQRPTTPARRGGRVSLTAAADVPGFSTGQNLDDLTEVAKAVISRAKGFGVPQGDGSTVSLQQFGTALLHLDFPDDLVVDRQGPEDIAAVLDHAADEFALEGGSLTAAGGWCSPSETMYDLDSDATDEGMLSLPEVVVKRGGMRFAVSPTFADFYANPGFIQTEAQAIAGTAKPCIEVDCPDFTEVRLDAEGICIKVPILTNAAYPEVVRNFVAGSLTAHRHWINANVIGRLVTHAGAARVFTGLGSTYSDSLEAMGLVIDQTRQKYRLSFRASVEVVVPFWVKNAFRADLGRRNGRGTNTVTDAEINSHFANIGANVQYVYDWQDLDLVDDEVPVGDNPNAYPATFNALVYPAGTFVKGTAPVINLNTVYDAASLQQNVYTGLFMEQGLLVAKRKFHADLLTLPVCNAGRTGAANFTC